MTLLGSSANFNGISLPPSTSDAGCEIPEITGERTLILSFSKSKELRDALGSLEKFSHVPLIETEDFKNFATMNKGRNPILIIDTGEGACDQETIDLAKWVKEEFPGNLRIATGKKLGDAAKLKFFAGNTCEHVEIYKEIASFLRLRQKIQEGRR